jgi:hypothetical protein
VRRGEADDQRKGRQLQVATERLNLLFQVRGFKTQPKPSYFFERKIPQHAFLRRGSKAVCLMSQLLRHVKEPINYVEVELSG